MEGLNIKIIESYECDNITVVRNAVYQYAVIDKKGFIIVPFGRYIWIDHTFSHGLGRVILYKKDQDGHSKKMWGVINEKGDIVLPFNYSYIRGFHDKKCRNIQVTCENKQVFSIDFNDLCFINNQHQPTIETISNEEGIEPVPQNPPCDDALLQENYDFDDYQYTYDKEDYSIEDSYMDAFDGELDAYWNID